MISYLYKRDSKEKIRVFILTVSSEDGVYKINRKTGLLNGTLVDQPELIIDKGKAKRTVEEQMRLQVKSLLNKQLDKGYKAFTKLTEEIDLRGRLDPHLDYNFIDSILAKGQTYASGNKKVMLALDPKVVKIDWNQEWYISKKLDGVRVTIIKEGKTFKALSRNGKDISPALTHIFNSPQLKKIFDTLGQDTVLDGELYKHGMILPEISGISRLKEYTPERHDKLEFWMFDFMHDTMTAEERIAEMRKITISVDNTPIKIVSHVKFNNYESIKAIHDIWVQEGFEGAIARQADATYQYGKKNKNMVKVKEFQDDEFEIVGIKMGLRGAEDMCFICKLPNDNTVDVKPMGSKELKEEYCANMKDLIGKKLTVKFFNYTEEGSLFLPSGKAVRDYE